MPLTTLTRTTDRSFSEPALRRARASETHRLGLLFRNQMPLAATVDTHLADAIGHVLQSPGSLARPRIVVRMAQAYGMAASSSDELAIALEYFHTASLLFDDLPCMDDAAERRGSTCVHRAHGESQAILVALALINRAYALLWRTIAVAARCDHLRAFAYVEQNLGTEGLLNGQSLDLNYGSLPHDRVTTERIAFGKTVSLIRLALVLPAMLGGAEDRELLLLERIAKYWGFAYQILDDLKDVLESPAATGKTTARDATLGRPNVSLTIGAEPALMRLSRLIRLGHIALRRLTQWRPELRFLEEMHAELSGQLATLLERHTRVQERGAA